MPALGVVHGPLAKGMRLSKDTPPSWRTRLLPDVARAHTDTGDVAGAVKALESLRRVAPTGMQHHTLAVAIVRDLWALPNHPAGLRPVAEFLGVGEQRAESGTLRPCQRPWRVVYMSGQRPGGLSHSSHGMRALAWKIRP